MSWRRLGRRLLQAVPVLLLVAIGVFVLLELAQGDAVDAYLAGIGGAGDLTLAAELRQRYGLADSLGARFLTYATSLATLDLGWSIAFARPVLDVILERLPKTLLLMGSGILLAALLGIGLGALAALRRGRPTDTVVTTAALVLNATPG
ncbi:MAG: ABC transporter permease, partial [Geminicoccaceae bacterium]